LMLEPTGVSQLILRIGTALVTRLKRVTLVAAKAKGLKPG